MLAPAPLSGNATTPAPHRLDADAYLAQRVDDQIAWLGRRSRACQTWHRALSVLQIACGAAIPFLVGLSAPGDTALKVAAGLLGMAVAIVTGALSLYRFQENWIRYRATGEALKQEKFLYLAAAAPYDAAPAPFALLVQRVEALLGSESSRWAQAAAVPPKT